MPEKSKYGTIWQDDELDLIVSDYFAMLSAELSGQPYVKSRHSAALMATIDRSHRSVEFKHQNVSAVMEKLGLPSIPGYKPKANYQGAIFDAIDRYLSKNPAALQPVPKPHLVAAAADVFVPAPHPRAERERMPQRLRDLVTKFDPVKRDYLNRTLGKAGESYVVEVERRRLISADRPDLAKKVRWTAQEDGDGAGYDVSSFDLTKERPLFIEVKTTNGSARTPFFLTRNEFSISTSFTEDWRIYRVHQFASDPRIFTIAPPLKDAVNLTPETWRASF